MGNSWGNCPSNINDQAERCGFSFCFFPPGICGHCRSKRLSTRNKPKGKGEDRKRKRAKKGKEKATMVCRCSIFSLEGPEPGKLQRKQGLDTQVPRCKHKLVHCLCHCFSLFLNTSFCCVVSCRSGILVPGDTDVKPRVFFSDTGPLQLSSSSLCDRLKPRTQVCIECMLDMKGNI